MAARVKTMKQRPSPVQRNLDNLVAAVGEELADLRMEISAAKAKHESELAELKAELSNLKLLAGHMLTSSTESTAHPN